jgi:hypothetical protein
MKRKLAYLLTVFITACAVTQVTGCSHSPRRVDCDGRLEAINPIAPAGKNKPYDTGREP